MFARIAAGLTALATLAAIPVASGVAASGSTHPDARVRAHFFTVAPGTAESLTARCPKGERALGGGLVETGPAAPLILQASGPLDATGSAARTRDGDAARQWWASVASTAAQGTAPIEAKVMAICAREPHATVRTKRFTLNAGTFSWSQ